MKFVVLIACHSDSESIYDTIKSLSTVTAPTEFDRVIIVENGDSSKLDKERVLKLSTLSVECIYTKQKGKSVALNVAIDNYIPDDYFILFTDDDIRFNESWLLNFSQAFKKHGRGYFYGSAFGVDYQHQIDPALLKALPPSAQGVSDGAFKKNPKRAFLGCNWAAHKDDIINAGLFNPNFGPGSKTGATGQESEMQDRLRKIGLEPMLVENNPVWHAVPPEKSSLEWAKERASKTGKERFIRKKGRWKWFMNTSAKTLVFGVWSMVGNREKKYRFIIGKVSLVAFLRCFFQK